MAEEVPPATYVRTKRLSQVTGVPESTWEKRRLTGDTPPYVKIGKVVIYDLALVHRWLAERTRRSTSDEPLDQRRVTPDIQREMGRRRSTSDADRLKGGSDLPPTRRRRPKREEVHDK
jgi:hypothetical protein